MKRRDFIKNTSKYSLGFVLLSGLLDKNDTYAYTLKSKPTPESWGDNQINIAWLGHSTVLIKFYDKIILTDPVLFKRVGINFFGYTVGPARFTPPALKPEEVPKPDIILSSHAHMDHMDIPTLEYFTEKYPNEIEVVVAYNTKDVIDYMPWKKITIMDWEDEENVLDIKIKALQVKHFGWRLPWERDRSKGYMKNGRSFNAYILSYKDTKILFGGDTANTDLFKKSGEKVDIAIMPIGAYQPWRMNHCNPEEALQMAHDMDAKVFIPIHTKTFRQGTEPNEEPLRWVAESYPKYNLKLGIRDIGDTFTT